MAFPERFIEELVGRSDIVDVVGSYVQLSKRSGANYFGLCPFHNERTPSFAVNPSGQFYHCFGCGKGGGVINFVMEIEGLSYPEAVAFLAKRAGLGMPEESYDPEAKKRTRLLALNREAALWFHARLQGASSYLVQRQISPAVARRFGLGFAPDSWDGLVTAMREKGYSEYEMFDAGLVRRGKSGGFYDTFRNRLMFPVIDVRGQVIGFSGRILGDGEPKYMNSPETMVFQKSRNLFGLNLAKKSKSGYLMLVEGNVDVVSLHQAGFDMAVASLGTSLTPDQARLMNRYTNEVIIAYDSDGAGRKAAQRAIGILEKLDMKVRILQMEGAKDPDEYLKARGADAFRNLIAASEDQVDYRLGSVRAKYDLSLDEQKVAYLREATELLASLPGAVERQVYAGRVAEEAGVGRDAVADEVERRRKRLIRRAQQSEERQIRKVERPAEPAQRYDNPVSAAAEEGVIRLLYLEPALGKAEGLPEAEEFTSPVLGHIYEVIRNKIREGLVINTASLTAELNPEEMSLLVRLLQRPEQLQSADKALRDYLARMQDQKERAGDSGSLDLVALRDRLRERKGYHP